MSGHFHRHEIIGTCSICNGAVARPSEWPNDTPPPVPMCCMCGAVPSRPFGEVIEMVDRKSLKCGAVPGSGTVMFSCAVPPLLKDSVLGMSAKDGIDE